MSEGAGAGVSEGEGVSEGAGVSEGVGVSEGEGEGASARALGTGVRSRVRTRSHREVARSPAYIATRTSVPTTRFRVAASSAGIAPT